MFDVCFRARDLSGTPKLIIKEEIFDLIPLYLVAMAVVMPILGQGFFFGSPPKAMDALMGHVAFGLVMSAIIGKPEGE